MLLQEMTALSYFSFKSGDSSGKSGPKNYTNYNFITFIENDGHGEGFDLHDDVAIDIG